MTPKEKANEIVNKFYELRAYETMALQGKRIAYGIAKDSAIICVEQIIDELSRIGGYDCEISDEKGNGISPNSRIEFWQQVLHYLKTNK